MISLKLCEFIENVSFKLCETQAENKTTTLERSTRIRLAQRTSIALHYIIVKSGTAYEIVK